MKNMMVMMKMEKILKEYEEYKFTIMELLLEEKSVSVKKKYKKQKKH